MNIRRNDLCVSCVSAICALDMDVGPCRGRFIRWFYDVSTHKCMEFTYGGCRGNNNRFRTFEECHDMCVEHMRARKYPKSSVRNLIVYEG